MAQSFVFVGDPRVGNAIAESLSRAGFPAARSVAQADVIFTYCTTMDTLEDVYFGDDGLVQAAHEGAVLVDLSPSTPQLATEIYQLAAVHGAGALDAPVQVVDPTHTDAFGDPSNLVILVGGEQKAFDDIAPMLRGVASVVSYCGDAGAGQAAKVALTINQSSQLMALIEADAFMRQAHGSLSSVLDIAESVDMVPESTLGLLRAIANEQFNGGFTAEMLMGELSAVMTAADESEVVLPHAEAALHLVELLMVVGGADMNATAVAIVYGDEGTCKRFGLDWSRAENEYEHDHDHDHDDWDEDHDHDEDEHCGNCDGHHDHEHGHSHEDKSEDDFTRN